LRFYDFWPLVADSTVIVQHVCSVAIFVCCFAGIYQDRISPVSVVGLASSATVLGWSLWDHWMGQEEEQVAAAATAAAAAAALAPKATVDGPDDGSTTTTGSEGSFNPVITNGNGNGHITWKQAARGLGLSLSTSDLALQSQDGKSSRPSKHSHSVSANSLQSLSPITPLHESGSDLFPPLDRSSSRPPPPVPLHMGSTLSPSLSPRVQSRLKTVKSAILIYLTLLGLSPILKSLTRSTSSDSIWALATWLLIINIFFFDYGGLYTPPGTAQLRRSPDHHACKPLLRNGPELTDASALLLLPPPPRHAGLGSAPPFPSSLSTNAALMASTVLASRLPSITHVFSLTVFSIEVFGLFPVFRRHLRHVSWNGHVLLTLFLVMASSAGMGIILSTSYTHTYGACGVCWGWLWHVLTRSVLGMLIGGLGTSLVMGGCSWWLISLQRYKNVVIGPWDPARPVLADGSLVRGRGSSG
jgi:phosphatidylinositol N-acetylglucosaminyltransferase subunit C